MLTTYDGDESVFRALENGAQRVSAQRLLHRRPAGGHPQIHSGGAHVSARAGSRLAERAMGGAALSTREIEVLNLIAAGKSNKEIGTLALHQRRHGKDARAEHP